MERIKSAYGRDAAAARLYVLDCSECAVVFAIPAKMKRERQADGQDFYCPNGHDQAWVPTEADELRSRLAEVEADRDYAWQVYGEADADRKRTAASLRTTKGHVTRLRNRAEAGVCIHCNRTFSNVVRHMQSKHGGAP